MQWGAPWTAPLYPVARIRFVFVITAPIFRELHVDLALTNLATIMKYSCHVGLFM
jgi:hypothetical protein